MAENLMKIPAKGILKNSTSFEGSSTQKCAASRGTKWDEMNILATHHPPDKDYGHMKIEEPKTPYSYHGEDSGDEEDIVDLDSNLLAEKLQADIVNQSSKRMDNFESDEDEEDAPVDKEKRKSFEFKRKAHYNEFMAVKLARQLMENEEEEDDVPEKEAQSSEVEEVDIDQDVEGSDDDLGIEGVENKENAEMDTKELSNETADDAAAAPTTTTSDIDISTL